MVNRYLRAPRKKLENLASSVDELWTTDTDGYSLALRQTPVNVLGILQRQFPDMFTRGVVTQEAAVGQILKSLHTHSKPTQVFSLSA